LYSNTAVTIVYPDIITLFRNCVLVGLLLKLNIVHSMATLNLLWVVISM